MKTTGSSPSQNYSGANYSSSSVSPSASTLGTHSPYPGLVIEPHPKDTPTTDIPNLSIPPSPTSSSLPPSTTSTEADLVGTNSLESSATDLSSPSSRSTTDPSDNSSLESESNIEVLSAASPNFKIPVSIKKLPPLPLPLDTHSDRFSPFKYNRKALLITTTIVSLMLVVGLATYFFGSHATKSSTTSQNSSAISSQYAVGNLPLSSLAITSQLKVGPAEQLTINGQLVVNDTVVLAPGIAPTTPLTGQFYYNKTTNQPYYYNGTTFVSLQPTTATTTSTSPQSTTSTTTTTPTVTSLASSTGAITLGQGLAMTANQLDIPTTFIQSQLTSLNATNLTTGTLPNTRLSPNVTMQGNTFNSPNQLVQLTASGLLPTLDGSNLTNINLTNLSASNLTTGTLADARLTANVALLNATQTFTSANTFSSALTLGTTGTNTGSILFKGSTGASGTLTIIGQTNPTTNTLTLPSETGTVCTTASVCSGYAAGGGSNVQLQATTPGTAQTGNSNITGTSIAGTFAGSGASLTSLNGTNVSSGTVADARLTTNVTLQGNTFNGLSQLVQTTSGGILPVISGANLTSLNATNISSGTIADLRLSANVALLNGTGPQTFSGNNTFSGTVSSPAYASTVITGTAPFAVASTTKVVNLNADLLDGLDSTAFGDATAANQTTILNRIGTNVDAAGTTTLFARLNNIDTGSLGTKADATSTVGTVFARFASLFSLIGTTSDAASSSGTVFARFAQLFTYIGTPSDAASSSGSLFAQVRDVRANVGSKTRRVVTLLSGTSWTVPAGVTYVNATLIGGGGSGGGGNNTGISNQGNGGQIVSSTLATTPGASITYAIGAGGIGATGAGNTGGTTSFTGATSALGGNGGMSPGGGPGMVGTNGASSGNGSGSGGGAGNSSAAGGTGKIEIEYWQ